MDDLLETGAAWLARTQKRHASQLVTYQRGNSSLLVRATRGRSVFDETDAQGLVTRVESQDFTVLVSDLELDGLATVPARGDRIIDGDNQFDVLPVGNEPCYRYTDEHRLQFRIHTKKAGEQP